MRLVLIAGMLCLAGRARAEDARLIAARAAFIEQDQERAIQVLAPVLGELGEHDRAVALRLLGCAAIVLGARDEATARFRASFPLEPDAALEPELASPDARGQFEIARGQWRAQLVLEMQAHAADIAQLGLEVRAPSQAAGGQPIAIAVAIRDPARLVERVELSYRRRGAAGFVVATRRGSDARAAFEIPAEATESSRPFALDYHVTLRHQTGFDLRRAGDAAHPRTIAVAAGRRPQWHDAWWARAAIGAGAIGLGVGGYLFYRSLDVGPQRVLVNGAR